MVFKGHQIPLNPLFMPLTGVVFGLLFLLAGIPLTKGIIRITWPTTTGIILTSELEQGPYARAMYVRLSYEYSVGDNKFMGSNIHNPQNTLFRKAGAEKRVKIKYAPQNQVKVYYNPHQPELAFLEPGPGVEEIFIFCLGLFLFVGGINITYSIIKGSVYEQVDLYKEPIPIRESIMAAIRTEEENPGEALRLYRKVQKQNTDFSLLIFIVSFIAPLLASVLAYRSSQTIERFNTIIEFIIEAYIAFGVPTMLRAFRDRRNGVVSFFAPEESRWFWINVLFTGPFFLVREGWLVLTAFVFTLVVLSPLVVVIVFDLFNSAINYPSLIIGLELLMPPVLFVFLLLLWADIRISDLFPPGNIVRILFAALHRNILEVLGNISVLVWGVVFVTLYFNYPANTFPPAHLAVIGGGLSGLFLALELCRGDFSTDVKVFVSLGMSRCHIRLKNWASARVVLRPVDRDDVCECLVRDNSKKICGWIGFQLMSLIEGIRLRYQPNNLDQCIDRAKEIVESGVNDREIWIENIKANQVLVEGEEIQTSLNQVAKRRRPI